MDNEPINNNNNIFGYANIENLMDPVVITEVQTILNTEQLGLFVNNHGLASLQAFLINKILPDNLLDLECDDNQLTKLPDLPDSLEWLSCNNNNITELPYLPDSLQYLYCYDNNMEEFPDLPESIKEVNCDDNEIGGIIDYLPNNLEILYCSNNQIDGLPVELPENLVKLNCSDNNITELTNLPESLRELYCRNNPFNDESIQKIIDFYERESTKTYTDTEIDVEEELRYYNLYLSKVVNAAFSGNSANGEINPHTELRKTNELSQKPTHLILDFLNYQKPPPPPPSQTGGKSKKTNKKTKSIKKVKTKKTKKSNKNKTKIKKTRKTNKLK
jgi:Leucine-rich repeat (LRR) protein